MALRHIFNLARGNISNELGELDRIARAFRLLGHAGMMPAVWCLLNVGFRRATAAYTSNGPTTSLPSVKGMGAATESRDAYSYSYAGMRATELVRRYPPSSVPAVFGRSNPRSEAAG